jgi:hypothetical protein
VAPFDTRVVTLPRERGEKPQETGAAVDPRDPDTAYLSIHQAVGDGTDHHPNMRVEVKGASTHDRGETWTIHDLSHPEYDVSIDAAVACDLRGNAYVVNMGMERIDYVIRHGEYVRRSTDGGTTWSDPVCLAERPAVDPILEHMPKIVADNNPDSPHAGNVYVTWDRVYHHGGGEEMIFVRSTDGGDTWSKPSAISRQMRLTLPAIAVSPTGTTYVGYAEAGESPGTCDFYVQRSRDGGATFSEPLHVVSATRYFEPLKSFPRGYWFPTLGVDDEGRLFAVWAERAERGSDLVCAMSSDEGDSWGKPVRVNAGAGGHFLPQLAVDSSDGGLSVFFFHRGPLDPDSPYAEARLARSTDGGRTFEEQSLGEPTDATLASLGDYVGLAASGGVTYGVWPEYVSSEAPPVLSRSYTISDGYVVGEGVSPDGPSALKVAIVDSRG